MSFIDSIAYFDIMTDISEIAAQDHLFSGQIIKQILISRETENGQMTRFFEKYPDDLIRQPIVKGRNSPYYLLGHLTATSDALVPHLRLGDLLFPDLEQFLKLPEQLVNKDIDRISLLNCWQEVNDRALSILRDLNTSEWLERHALVSPEDFQKEPRRNRLNILISRLGHQRYHAGQLALFIPGNSSGQ